MKLKLLKKQDKPYDCIASISGGIDSVVIAHWLKKKEGKNPLCVFFDYGQQNAKMERKLSRKVCKKLKLDLLIIPLKFYSKITDSKIFGEGEETKGAMFWLEGRNILMAIFMAILASKHEVKDVYLGCHEKSGEEENNYKDITTECWNAFNDLIGKSFQKQVFINCPFNDWEYGKEQIIDLGVKLGVNFKHTHTCCINDKEHCWTCEACEKRKKAFQRVGVKDPLSNG